MSLVRLALIGLYTAFWGTTACVGVLLTRNGDFSVWVARNWLRWVLATSGVRVEAEGLDNVPFDRPCVFMSNHESHYDVAAIVDTLPVQWRFVAKRELTRVPFFGWALALGGHVIIDRSDRTRAVRSLQAAAEQIRSGTNVIIFPEGTRSETGEMGEFKSGGFHLAIQAGVPIVPIAIEGSRAITPKKSLRIEPGRIRLLYRKPIPTTGIDIGARGELKREVREAIEQGLRELESADVEPEGGDR